MKKVIIISVSYTLFCLVVCVLYSALNKSLPLLLPSFVNGFILRRGILYFIDFMPALIASSFLIGCSIIFSASAQKAQVQFSSTIIKLFESVMVYSILCIFLIMVCREVIKPVFVSSQNRAQEAPRLLAEYLNLSKEYRDAGNIQQAHDYAEYAMHLDPSNKDAILIEEQTEAQLNIVTRAQTDEKDYTVSFFQGGELINETVSSLLNKARAAYENEKWFEAHYYAQMAVSIGTDRDTNIKEARELASFAWNKLEKPVVPKESEEQIFYRDKRNAYEALIAEDDIEAYFQFVELNRENEQDSDVKMFLDIARKRIAQQVFYIDETNNLIRFESCVNVYFAVKHRDGSKDVVYIQGITPVKSTGGMIQYLRGLNVVSFDKAGKFVRSLYVPYAKLVAKPVSIFSREERINYGIYDDFKYVPYIMLESIDREGRGGINLPVYKTDSYLASNFMLEERNYIVLGMSLDDFNLMCEASVGADNMNLTSLLKMSSKAKNFGFANEAYGASFLRRSSYPMFLLDILIFLACIAWNYRLKDGQVFKFKWIVVFPLTSAIMYFLIECTVGILGLINYLFISIMGPYAIVSAGVCGVIIFVLLSIVFLTRVTSVS